MLGIHCHGTQGTSTWTVGKSLLHYARRVDRVDPLPDQQAVVESLLATSLPKRGEINRRGLSSPRHADGPVMSLRVRLCTDHSAGASAPVHTLATKEQLVTLRYQSSCRWGGLVCAAACHGTDRFALSQAPGGWAAASRCGESRS